MVRKDLNNYRYVIDDIERFKITQHLFECIIVGPDSMKPCVKLC